MVAGLNLNNAADCTSGLGAALLGEAGTIKVS
jgi:hypothetical protein